jgi:hypothetical protein
MKKLNFQYRNVVFVLLVVFTSCANESTSLKESTQVLDLNNFSFNEAKALLESGRSVLLKDGESEIPISAFSTVLDAGLSVPGNSIVLYEANANDSVSVSLCDQFVSFRIGKDGDQLGYVSYANDNNQKVVDSVYAQAKVKTGSSYSAVKRSVSQLSAKINITEVHKAMVTARKQSSNSYTQNDYISISPVVESRAMLAATSSVDSSTDNPYVFPRKKVVTIYLLMNSKLSEFPPIPHELVWAEEDVLKSVADVFKNDKSNVPKIKFITKTCDFQSTEKALVDLRAFQSYVLKNKDAYPTAGKDIYCFVRNGDWGYHGYGTDDATGISCGTYNINREYNGSPYLLSATTAIFRTTLAHELGHIFGAVHTTTPWYKLNTDLMNAIWYIWVKPYHRDDVNQGDKNRNTIYKNLKEI